MKQYVVDAFTDKVFSGNPAAVCIMDEWLPDDLMLKIAMENNLSETAFAVNEGDRYRLRWFTPGGEIDLCGHATLAAAYVLMNYYDKNMKEVVFSTMSGDLTAGIATVPLAAGFLAAFVTGCLACKFMIEVVKRGKLIWFAVYCTVAGLVSIISYFC